MNNVLHLINDDLRRHRVTVTLPGAERTEDFYLIMLASKTSKLRDFTQTFPDLNRTHLKLAKKLFGDEESDSIYGVLIDEDLKLVYAFNVDFADFDSKQNLIVYKDVDDILLAKVMTAPISQDELSQISANGIGLNGRNILDARIMYSLTEKE
jgi:hypothetical protein